MAGNIFNRYIWLVDTINRAGKITLAEINRKWLQTDWSEKRELPRRTFINYRKQIEELFDINIDCNNYNQYYIATDMDNGVRTWLLNTFAINNLIHENHSLNRRILFEEIPSGERFLTTIIEAMRDEFCIEISYLAFWMNEPLLITIKPFCVKVFKQRWYVIGENYATNKLRRYSLDRMIEVEIVAQKFKMPQNFEPVEHFAHSFGIVVDPKIKPCIVQIKYFGKNRKYLQTLPLHSSQKEVETNDKYSVFQYYIAPTSDFTEELLSHGEDIEVIEPDDFRNEISSKIEKMNNRYKKIK
jgi:hypothetical protein